MLLDFVSLIGERVDGASRAEEADLWFQCTRMLLLGVLDGDFLQMIKVNAVPRGT